MSMMGFPSSRGESDYDSDYEGQRPVRPAEPPATFIDRALGLFALLAAVAVAVVLTKYCDMHVLLAAWLGLCALIIIVALLAVARGEKDKDAVPALVYAAVVCSMTCMLKYGLSCPGWACWLGGIFAGGMVAHFVEKLE